MKKRRLNENQKVTITFGQLKKLIKENIDEIPRRPEVVSEASNDYDFMAAIRFILKNRKNMNFIKAVDRVIDELGGTGDLHSAIELACKDDEETAEIVSEYFEEAYPSAMSYDYHPARGWDGDPEVLESLMDLPQVVVSNAQIFTYLVQD